MLFVLQTDAAAAQYPITGPTGDAALQQIERAFASCTPSAAELERIDKSERVHRGGAVRKKRRKMKRAGKKTKAAAAARFKAG